MIYVARCPKTEHFVYGESAGVECSCGDTHPGEPTDLTFMPTAQTPPPFTPYYSHQHGCKIESASHLKQTNARLNFVDQGKKPAYKPNTNKVAFYSK